MTHAAIIGNICISSYCTATDQTVKPAAAPAVVNLLISANPERGNTVTIALETRRPLDAQSVSDGAETARSELVQTVEAARRGDRSAWTRLFDRYTPLIRRVIRQFRISDADAADISQVVWMRLFQNLNRIREPLALPGWIMTTTKNEAIRMARSGRHTSPMDPTGTGWSEVAASAASLDQNLLSAECAQVIEQALILLPDRHRELLTRLHGDSEASYAEISKQLDIPIGSIGPTRSRSLKKLRHATALVEYVYA